MQVKCDKCGQGYEVDQSRITPKGARIKCPACANILTVRLVNGQLSVFSSNATPTPSMANIPAIAPAAVPASAPAAAGSNTEEEESWRVRHMGLTYSFHTLDALQEWLSGRGSLDDVKVAKGDSEWKELGDYSEVMTMELITKFFPLGDVPTSKNKIGKLDFGTQASEKAITPASDIRIPTSSAPSSFSSNLSTPANSKPQKSAKQTKREKAQAEAKKKAQKKKIIKTVVAVVVGIMALIVALRLIKSGEVIPGSSNQVANNDSSNIQKALDTVHKTSPEAVQAKADNPNLAMNDLPKPKTDDEIQQLAEADIENRLSEARDMVKEKKWPEARATLESIINDRPGHIEAYQLLAKTFRGLGLNDKAAETENIIKVLQDNEKNLDNLDIPGLDDGNNDSADNANENEGNAE